MSEDHSDLADAIESMDPSSLSYAEWVEVGMATPKQVRMLERNGFSHPGAWTFDQAGSMMTRLANNHWMVPDGINPATYVPTDRKEDEARDAEPSFRP